MNVCFFLLLCFGYSCVYSMVRPTMFVDVTKKQSSEVLDYTSQPMQLPQEDVKENDILPLIHNPCALNNLLQEKKYTSSTLDVLLYKGIEYYVAKEPSCAHKETVESIKILLENGANPHGVGSMKAVERSIYNHIVLFKAMLVHQVNKFPNLLNCKDQISRCEDVVNLCDDHARSVLRSVPDNDYKNNESD